MNTDVEYYCNKCERWSRYNFGQTDYHAQCDTPNEQGGLMRYNLYKTTNNYVPDLELVKVEGTAIERDVWFLWRGTKQNLRMSRDNEYGDWEWMITHTEYTDEFDIWLDENLDLYDSLESTFELDDLIPTNYTFEFKTGNNG